MVSNPDRSGRRTRAGSRSLAATRRLVRRVLSTHRAAALASSARADVRLALTLLLRGLATGFLGFGASEVLLVFGLALVLGSARFLERDRNRLTPALHLAAPSFRTAFQLGMLEFVHDSSGRLSLSRRGRSHVEAPF